MGEAKRRGTLAERKANPKRTRNTTPYGKTTSSRAQRHFAQLLSRPPGMTLLQKMRLMATPMPDKKEFDLDEAKRKSED